MHYAQLSPGVVVLRFDPDEGRVRSRRALVPPGGIFAALSESTAALTIVSYDLNYRVSFCKTICGLKKAQEVNREITKYVDVRIGSETARQYCEEPRLN